MPRRRKAYPCGHIGFGQFCHPCRERGRALEVRRQEKAAKAAVLDASPIHLYGLPSMVQRKALEVIEAISAGRPWQDFKGKKIESRHGVRVVVPLGWSYRLLFKWNGNGGLAPEEAL